MKLEEIRSFLPKTFRDSRTDFTETWLAEMPEFAGTLDTFPSMLAGLNDFLKHGHTPVDLGKNVFKIHINEISTYWVEHEHLPVLIVEIKAAPEACQINMTGKKAEQFGRAPYASDLYELILKDNVTPLLISDEYLTDSSFEVWARLLKGGKKISVYDVKSVDLIPITSVEQLKTYYHPTGNRFRFAISESALKECYVKSNFRLYGFRRDNGIL